MTAAKNLSLKCLWEWMKNERGLLLFAFVLVFLKKWEPGGHIDATWYSAVARNIAEKGDFFHFYINPFFANEVFDHFPLDYWIMGGLMSLFGVSDFIARLYFMICSFASLLWCQFFWGRRFVIDADQQVYRMPPPGGRSWLLLFSISSVISVSLSFVTRFALITFIN